MQFKQIEGYDNYIVFENGNVQNINSGKILKPFTNSKGYLYIQLSENNIQKKYLVHILVSSAFLGNKPENYQTDHIDRNKLNNHYTNLRYVSQSDNMKNRNSYNNIEVVYQDEIPEHCVEMMFYNERELENIFIDPKTIDLYQFNGVQYRKQYLFHQGGNCYYYNVRDKENNRIKINLNVLKKLLNQI
ncbi:NUMOD4_motif protein [Hexamita inflata]|uniref:NUMOD4 motif protein n=1 Tax=Hexamita inflata TaxID=28002 RepID=A0AA86UDK1_9EUKA|nr:NUMOD4 motif protein [Hexamita inflata]